MKKNSKILIIVSFFLFFAPLKLFSQSLNSTPDDFRFKKIGIEEGLSQSTILCILQDKLGYLWFGTANGLNRYDGYEFVVYTNLAKDSLSISDNEITSLYEDDEGFIWIGTAKGMLNKFDPKTETFRHYDIASSSDWYSIDEEKFYDFPLTFSRNQNSTITTIDQDNEGFLWIGTWGKGLLKFHHKTNQKKYIYHYKNRINSLSSNKIVKIFIDKHQTGWIGTFGGGLNRIDSIKAINTKFINKNQYINFARIGERITSIAEDKKGNLIVGDYNNGVSIIDYSKKYNSPNDWQISKLKLSSNEVKVPNIMAVNEDKSNNIWIGTAGQGLYRYDQNTKSILHYISTENPNSLSENEIQTIYVDNSGIVWVGTQLGSGINKLESNKNKFNSIPVQTSLGSSLNDNIIWSIYEDTENNLWVGTYRGGLNKCDLNNNSFTYFDADKVGDNHIRSIVEDYKGNLWIGTYSAGLTFYNKKENKFKYFRMGSGIKSLQSNQIQSFLIDNGTTLYIG
ncbi:MAG: hypothetical protein KDC52_15085, partial [Ignavibacteriae bacterium]|nr:hypothetical protein [Ignavibacteriota bacterium]